ncbi:MAG TPA: hypothetical protein VJ725_09480 [Thermoanaerobaculia bacterium]|nr:hypothetical protein [Thermoanaerobaculia bacterium]
MTDEARKDLALELAARLAKPEGLRMVRLLEMAGLVNAPASPGEPRPTPKGPRPISIWSPREVDGEPAFVRPDPLPLGDHYAAPKILRPKKSELPLRVCFFGESVAAGYLYAPHLTPAKVLETQLRAVGGESNFEVIDLARTNERLETLVETVQASLQINPDVLVLFVGNNWNLLETPGVSPYALSVPARQRYAQALREWISGPLRLAEEELRRSAESALDTIALIARAVGIPVVVVLPEVNLADWETRQPPVCLPGDGTARWHSLYQDARERLNRKDFDGAAEAAQEMLALDGATCPSTFRIFARALQGTGDLEEVLRAARVEVDASAYANLCFLAAPQAGTLVRDLLQDAAHRHGFFSVDLPAIFAEHTGSPLPGRRLFLDYCHLTTEGIEVAMAAVAAEVLALSGLIEESVDWRNLLSAPAISPEAEATARLGAAIHTAHRLLPVSEKSEILEYWLEAALDASPGIEKTMLDLVAARSAPCPAVLTAAQQRNLSSPYRLLLQHGWRWEHLDADLIQAISNVLERRGRSAWVEIVRGLLEGHGLREEETDLANPFYLWEPLERFYPEVMTFEDLPRRGTLRSPWPETSFCLIVDGTRDVEVEPTLRLPGEPGNRWSEVRVSVNGAHAGAVEATERWTRTSLRIGRDLLRPGLNRLTLCWPPPSPAGDDPLQTARERLEMGIAADLHPVFGEVFSLIAWLL